MYVIEYWCYKTINKTNPCYGGGCVKVKLEIENGCKSSTVCLVWSLGTIYSNRNSTWTAIWLLLSQYIFMIHLHTMLIYFLWYSTFVKM